MNTCVCIRTMTQRHQQDPYMNTLCNHLELTSTTHDEDSCLTHLRIVKAKAPGTTFFTSSLFHTECAANTEKLS